MSKIIGIDFGTTNSLAAYANNGKARTIKGGNIEHILPSVVCKYDGKLIVGKDAKDNISIFTGGSGIAEIKKMIGSNKTLLFDGKQMKPYEISAIILKKIKRNLKLYFEEDVNEAVITVPAQFSNTQRSEIIKAGEAAGFKVRKIINEPTAALLAYAAENEITSETVLCYDYGGGTFDVSIAHISGSRYSGKSVEILATDGDRQQGGADIDRILFKLVNDDLLRKYGECFSNQDNYGAIQVLRTTEKVKIELSSKQEATVSIPDLKLPSGKNIGYFKSIKRAEFERLIEKEIDKTIKIVKRAIDSTNLSTSNIDKVLLVGGTSRIPLVTEKINEKLGLTTTFGGIHPDECVAIGAAIEAANLSGNAWTKKKVGITRDVCPFTLGLKYEDGHEKNLFDPLITKNFPYGEEYSEEYVTVLDNQNSMELEIYQGESSRANKNEKVCTFTVKGIPERRAGLEKVRIHFKYDTDGILNIRAKVLSTGVEVQHSQQYGYNIGASMQSKRKIEEQFISEGKIEEAMALAKSVRIYGEKAHEKKILEAIKFEDEDALDDITKDLLS
ncbi:Hsp70 family protein [Bacillus luti]|uniref:Hsp70 family protein n=1 Tax=Bacillus luti TaxID=2026191 RepID=UPI003774BF9B